MKPIRTAKNVEFDVIYTDNGEKRHVAEGVLFESNGNNLTVHVGTNRINVLFSIYEGVLEIVKAAGLEAEFMAYISDGGHYEVEKE